MSSHVSDDLGHILDPGTTTQRSADALVDRLRRGDADAFSQLVRSWSPMMLRLARSIELPGNESTKTRSARTNSWIRNEKRQRLPLQRWSLLTVPLPNVGGRRR
jgi:hypothetical protein